MAFNDEQDSDLEKFAGDKDKIVSILKALQVLGAVIFEVKRKAATQAHPYDLHSVAHPLPNNWDLDRFEEPMKKLGNDRAEAREKRGRNPEGRDEPGRELILFE